MTAALGVVDVRHGDALDVLRTLPDASVDAVVTDPPYGLATHKAGDVAAALTAWLSGDREHVPTGRGFMGRAWDAFVPPPAVWDECLRVLRPGGHLLCFAGSRTVDLMGLSIRLAGFEMRDTITWHYGNGMPKSLDVSKQIDKAAGAEREVVGPGRWNGVKGSAGRLGGITPDGYVSHGGTLHDETAPATDAARRWSGWGTALKPASEPVLCAQKPFNTVPGASVRTASEPIIVARRPLAGTVAGNVLQHGVGALNIAACRVLHASAADLAKPQAKNQHAAHGNGARRNNVLGDMSQTDRADYDGTAGRWPSNVVLSHAATAEGEDACAAGCVEGCPVAELDAQSGITVSTGGKGARSGRIGSGGVHPRAHHEGVVGANAGGIGDRGGASRFFPVFRYQAKAPSRERPKVDGVAHPTVKPLALMRWLLRLVTPPGGHILDPFAGSGTTAEACVAEGFQCITVEREADYLPLIEARLARVARDGAHGVQVEKPTKEIDGQDDLLSLLGGGAA